MTALHDALMAMVGPIWETIDAAGDAVDGTYLERVAD
jgi:hypothetical protein